jgi:hypothetical protein
MREPVRAQTPVLLVSGAWDPVTPAADAAEAAATLPHSLSLVVPAGGHGYNGVAGAEECVDAIAKQFIERGSVDGVDTGCIARLHRSPFPTKPVDTKPVALTAEQQRALAGHYTGDKAPPFDITSENGKLFRQGDGEGEPRMLLVPVSPTRLRILGRFGNYFDFDIENGKAAAVTLQRSGAPTLRWKRSG